MKYTIDVEVNQFQDKVLRAKAVQQETSVEDVLTDVINKKVSEHADAMIADALNTKLTKMDKGRALAILQSMDN